jgi:cyclic 2,3-diphosphoglycerate synthetase
LKTIRALVLIDGEHYPPVVRQAVEEIESSGVSVVGAVFLGGTEKIEGLKDYAFNFKVFHTQEGFLQAIRQAVETLRPDVAIDLSDEPVIGYEERMMIASLLSFLGVDYLGADFTFKAPRFIDPGSQKTVGVIGTGKRVGKTAVSAALARYLKKQGRKVVVLAMGRGGPEEPVVLDGETILINNRFLLELKEAGKHAASDYVEDAMMSRIATVGCRRCGGGMAGLPFVSNVVKGFEIARSLNPDIIVLEGSGSAIPPVRAQKYLTVSNLLEPESHVIGYLGPYRLFLSRLLVLTNCETPVQKSQYENISKQAKKINPEIEVVGTIFRPRPLESLKGERVFLAVTAREEFAGSIARYLEETESCEVVYVSTKLASRSHLRKELEVKKREFTAIAMELKAAAVDVALDFAVKNDKRAVFFDNLPHVVTAERTMDDYFSLLVD